MADLFCSFLDFQSLNTNFKIHLFLPPKHYCSSALIHSHSSRICGMKRRPLHLTLLSRPSSSNFDVVSTHEHSDGSLLFRFGDPSEVAKIVKMEESKTVKEEMEREGEDGYTVVKVLDGDHEAEVIVKNTDREVTSSGLTQVSDQTDSIVISSGSICVVEGDNDSFEKLLEGSNDSELPVLNSSNEVEVISTLDNDIDVERVGNVEEDMNGEHEDSRPAEASMLDENSENGNSVTTVELSEEETAGITSTLGVVVEHSGNVEEVLNEDSGDSSPTDTSILDKSSEMENNITKVESLEREDTAESTTLISLMPKPVIAVPDNDVSQASLETVLTTDASSDSEHENLENEMQNESVEGGRETVESDLVSQPPQSQAAISLSEEIEDQNLQARVQDLTIGKGSESEMNQTEALGMTNVIDGNSTENDMNDTEAKYPPITNEAEESGTEMVVLNEIVEDGNESDVIHLNTVSPQLKAAPMLDEETGANITEESAEDDGAESLTALNDIPQNLILGSERTEVDDNLQTGNLAEASGHELTELKSTESAQQSQEILRTNFVLSSGAALLPHPSKTGGEDAYFIAGQTWLGVADGVGQWSLEGTKPGVYARELMKNCEKFISDHNGDSLNNPMELLNLGVAETHYPGPSTVLIAQLVGQDLHVANVGDSGFIVLRHGAVYKRSSPMLHAFDFTKQIERDDDPSHLVELYRVDLEEDDVIITATDGLLDNLYDQEISSIVVNSLAADKKLEEIAELLAAKAQEIGRSTSGRSPFADNAQAAGFAGYTGGKLDDVAVIVSIVQRQSAPQTL
ncbi:putative protein phosphatase 2C 71 [Sesamum alatum]|uniref:PPM-type phosphatase domain-containing protein n=1 Tax=Sesamum alatum TaxID=300844 RepID=A0AAE1YX32_9LAMI|nr:putative protein phosphatase 2C 71 [Sesamum alatum]